MDGCWFSEEEINKEIQSFFKKLYTRVNIDRAQEVVGLLPRIVNDEMNQTLLVGYK